MSWNSSSETRQNGTIFKLQFKARKNGKLSEALNLDSRLIEAEAYNTDLDHLDVQLRFNGSEKLALTFELFQNQPNPFAGQTSIGFYLPESGMAELKIFDLAGRDIKCIYQHFSQGFHSVLIDRSELSSQGVLYYQLNTTFGSLTRKMILIENPN